MREIRKLNEISLDADLKNQRVAAKICTQSEIPILAAIAGATFVGVICLGLAWKLGPQSMEVLPKRQDITQAK